MRSNQHWQNLVKIDGITCSWSGVHCSKRTPGAEIVICLTPASCIWIACDRDVGAEDLTCSRTTGVQSLQLRTNLQKTVAYVPWAEHCLTVFVCCVESDCFQLADVLSELGHVPSHHPHVQ